MSRCEAPNADPDGTPGWGKLGSIVEELIDGSTKPFCVAVAGKPSTRHVEGQSNPTFLEQRGTPLDVLTHDLSEVVFVWNESKSTGLASRDIEEVVDQPAKALDTVVHRLEGLVLRPLQRT